MANVSSLKGVRTRYRNTLSAELDNANAMILSYSGESDGKRIIPDAKRCLKMVNTYSVKLEEHLPKLTDCIGDADTDFVKRILDEDCALILKAEYCAADLEQFITENGDKDAKTDVKTAAASNTDSLLEMQQNMQKMMMTQMEQQRDFFERQAKREKEKEVCSVKLPKLDLTSFGGNKLKWVAFWDAFECSVHSNTKLPKIEKFNYLMSKLYGEAKKAVEGLSLSNANYDVAIEILKERFGNTQDVVNLHYKELINTPPVSQKIDSLRAFSNTIEKHLRSLDVLDEDINQHVFVSIITSKLPEPVLRQLELEKGSKEEWTVDKLRGSIREYVTACEKADRTAQVHRDNSVSRGAYNRTGQQFDKRFNRPGDNAYTSSSPKPYGSAQALAARATVHDRKVHSDRCRYCSEKHWSDECQRYGTIEERKKVLRGSCYKCLKEGHFTKDCKTKKTCVYCSQTNIHHRSLCPTKFNINPSSVHFTEVLCDTEDKSPEQDFASGDHVLVSSNEMVLMQTAKTNITNPKDSRSRPVRILLDSGSQRTYITESLAKELGLKTEEEQELKLVTFGSENAKRVKTKSTQIGITLNDGTQMKITANIVPTISGTLQRNPMKQQFSSEMEHLIKSINLADTLPTEKESSTLDVLVGNDYYLDLVLSQKIEVAPGLYLLSSKLGWILSGRTNDVVNDNDDVNMLIMTHGTDILENSVFTSLDDVIPTKPDIEDFWNLESMGVTDKAMTSEDDEAMESFKNSLQFIDGRYYITWPWKEETPDLPVNRELVYGRLKSCLRKLSGKPELLKKYDAIIQYQLQKGVIEKVNNTPSSNLQHYIPHHAVLTPQKTTTKLRVVYDASSKTRPEYNSLNECLFRGPVMLHDLCGLLMRFRLHRVALVSDIEKAFLQIGLQPDQRDVTRFLWLKSCENVLSVQNNIQEYRFCRVPFGVISSPFLLGAAVEAHLDSYNSDISNKLKENIYVDNVITGTDKETEAIEFYKTAKTIFKDASMNLREWCSNSDSVNASIPSEDSAKDKDTRVLGYTWNRKNDTLVIKQPKLYNASDNLTKRIVLKSISSVFDPLGLSSPVMLQGKLLLQKLWSKNLQWDEPIVDNDLQREVNKVCSDLNMISDFPFERCVCNQFSPESVVYNLLCFCDASKGAYATAVYLHQESKCVSKTDLLFAKTRLAPVKGMTIPRLELMAVLIGVRCVKFVKQQMGLPIQNVFLWTDSQCVLGWINSTKKLPVFVKNRVSEIKEHSGVVIRYVNTKENPADIATRGTTAKELQTNALWWHGPAWLNQPSDSWCHSHETSVSDESEMESIEINTESLACNENEKKRAPSAPFDINCDHFSCMTHLIRVTALAARFVKRVRKQPCESGSLKSCELNEAECMWLKYVQQKCFGDVIHGIQKGKATNLERQLGLYQDDHGLLRSKGRLEHSSLSEGARCPILLPKKERVTQLIVEKVHKQNFHAGVSHTLAQVRHRFWILHGRVTVRSVVQGCMVCRRNEGGPYKMPPMSPFPKSRVTETRPFNCTGLDYMGPLYIQTSDGAQKVWICLFTCFVSRAVHLEVVLDMSAEQFLLCFRRFVSQRGTPCEIISDNAQQFKAAGVAIDRVWKQVLHCDDVQNYVSEKGIKYSFIVELAPWMGGFYERRVGVVKRAMRKSIGRKMLSLIHLQTLLKEIEAVVNSRPLVYVGDDINSNITLTPNHFLSLNPDLGIPEIDYDNQDCEFRLRENSQDKLLNVWKKGQKMLDNFWQIWKDEYLASLRERMQFALKAGRIQSPFSPRVGDVVLIKDDLPRGCWKMGKVSELIPSRDGHVRSAKVSTSSGRLLGRPLKLLYPIECSNAETKILKNRDEPVSVPKQRHVRKAAEKARQNIRDQISHL